MDYGKNFKIGFGSYAQIHEEHGNSMMSRTNGAIALVPSGNSQGSYFFLSLVLGRSVNRGQWTELPITEDVIQRVNNMGRQCQEGYDIMFGLCDGTPINDIEGMMDVNDEVDNDDGGSVIEVDAPGEDIVEPPGVIYIPDDVYDDVDHQDHAYVRQQFPAACCCNL